MTVKGLETFCEKTPGVLVDVNLKELIEEELTCTGVRPTIVIDQSVLSFLCESEASSSIFGQPATTKIKIKNFVEKLISCGANVIVVLRGNSRKNPVCWFNKQKNNFERNFNEANNINYSTKFLLHYCYNKTLTSISNEHYKVLTPVQTTYEEVAKVAAKEKCLVVLGQDSNYLIYEEIRLYVSLKSFDFETLNCKYYDRNKLLKCLGLKSYQLPLFASLCGNDVVPYIYMKPFLKRLSHVKMSAPPLVCVAEMVKNTSTDPYRSARDLVKLIATKNITANLIEKSLDMYLKFEEIHSDNELLKFVLERTRKNDWSYKLCNIFMDSVYYSKVMTGFSDVSITGFELLRPLRKKIYGILFHPRDATVKEYCVEEILLHNCKKVYPKKVVGEVHPDNPGLIKLFEMRTPEMNLLRWKIFLSCVSEKLCFSLAGAIPQKCLFSLLALHYMQVTLPSHFPEKKIFKEKFEVEAFFLSALLLIEYPNKRLENYEPCKPDLWELQLTILYLQVCRHLSLLNEVCGFAASKQNACICNFYDGELTHYVYNKMKRGATCEEFFEGNAVLEATFYTLMDIIVTES